MDEEKRMRYSDDSEEWQEKEHRLVKPPEKKEKSPDTELEKTLKGKTNKKKKGRAVHPQCEKQEKDLDKKNYNWWE